MGCTVTDRMKWKKLVSQKRLYTDDTSRSVDEISNNPYVHPNQKDVDRILFSSSFRRLQGKAQVFLFPESDYYRNRLTHTLEVVSNGRILATAIFRNMEKRDQEFIKFLKKSRLDTRDMVESVAAACYAHDIGNSPFGHIGEYAIRSWFDKRKDSIPSLKQISKTEINDWSGFSNFDGNPQGFRVITRLQGWKERGGLQLTITTLGSFLKYPFGPEHAKRNGGKFGYYESERRYFERLSDELGLIDLGNGVFCRHPFALIMEAADDIAYLATDIEDSVKAKLIPFEVGLNLLMAIAKLSNRYDENRFNRINPNTQDAIKYLRSAAMQAMIEKCANTFVSEIDAIMHGQFEEGLVSTSSEIVNLMKDIRANMKKYVYFENKKIVSEAGGYNTITQLMDMMSSSVEEYFKKGKNFDNMNDKDKNVFRILTKNSTDLKAHRLTDGYQRMVDFVSGMTDRYAYKLCHDVHGYRIER